jgi:hypothetical protein
MRILFGVNCFGMGHLTQAQNVAAELLELGHELAEVFLLVPNDMDESRVQKIAASSSLAAAEHTYVFRMGITYGDMTGTVAHMASPSVFGRAMVSCYRRGHWMRQLANDIEEHGVDCAITFFIPFIPYLGVPQVDIANQWSHASPAMVAVCLLGQTSRSLRTSMWPRTGRTMVEHMLPPLISKKVLDIAPASASASALASDPADTLTTIDESGTPVVANKGRFALVYLVSRSHHLKRLLEATVKRHPGWQFMAFAPPAIEAGGDAEALELPAKDAGVKPGPAGQVSSTSHLPNLHWHTPSKQFKLLFPAATVVLCTAGNQTIAESCLAGKSTATVAQEPTHWEQTRNVDMYTGLGWVREWTPDLEMEDLRRWKPDVEQAKALRHQIETRGERIQAMLDHAVAKHAEGWGAAFRNMAASVGRMVTEVVAGGEETSVEAGAVAAVTSAGST